MVMSKRIFYAYLTGRNRTATERTGHLFHAIQGEDNYYPGFGKAICGAQPGRRSNGWSEHRSDYATCPKCLKKLQAKP